MQRIRLAGGVSLHFVQAHACYYVCPLKSVLIHPVPRCPLPFLQRSTDFLRSMVGAPWATLAARDARTAAADAVSRAL